MGRILPAIVLLAAGGVAAQPHPAGQRISRIERGLVPPIVVSGRPVRLRSLDDRMRELKVPGVSVAVFHDGHIEWTRGWGFADVDGRRKVDDETLFQAASI